MPLTKSRRERIGGVVRALTPFAASTGRAGGWPALEETAVPDGTDGGGHHRP